MEPNILFENIDKIVEIGRREGDNCDLDVACLKFISENGLTDVADDKRAYDEAYKKWYNGSKSKSFADTVRLAPMTLEETSEERPCADPLTDDGAAFVAPEVEAVSIEEIPVDAPVVYKAKVAQNILCKATNIYYIARFAIADLGREFNCDIGVATDRFVAAKKLSKDTDDYRQWNEFLRVFTLKAPDALKTLFDDDLTNDYM